MDPRIFYFCHRHNIPRGGQKHTYRHVDILNENGLEAYVFHAGGDFRLNWFSNETNVITENEFRRRINPSHDIVVLPEDLGLNIVNFPGKKVVFNKNTFSGFQVLGRPDGPFFDPYLSSEVVAALVVSEHNRAQLRLAYPRLLVKHVTVDINTELFRFRPLGGKLPLIASSVKSAELLLPLYHILRARTEAGLNAGKLFQWVFLDAFSEEETARVLSDSLLFISLSVAEGIGRLPLEAMASGCLLVTQKCGPLSDIAVTPENFGYADLEQMVLFIEKIMAAFPGDLNQWRPFTEEGREHAALFSRDRQVEGVVRAWTEILSEIRSTY